MTDKKPKVNSLAYTELSIQIATLSAKVDKLLELAMKDNTVTIIGDAEIKGNLSDDEQFSVDFK